MKIRVILVMVTLLSGCISQREESPHENVIKESFENEFAVYNPILVKVDPKVEGYSLLLSETKNGNSFNFKDREREFLQKNGFFVKKANHKQFYELYKLNTKRGIPNFITTDSMLHAFHILYDYTLRIAEEEKLLPELEALTLRMLRESENQYENLENPKLKEAAKRNVAYFCVAASLLNLEVRVPFYVQEEVERELSLIESHSGLEISPIFSYKEDYSQYVPRGHYTRSEALKRYFKVMMWYGRITFRLSPRERERGIEETRSVLLIVHALDETNSLESWDRIYQPTVFFVGKTDDLNVYEYLKLLREVYGKEFSVDVLESDSLIEKFIEKARLYRNPKINSSFVTDQEDFEEITKGFRFMGGRFIPDSYIFQQLVYDEVLFYEGSGEPFTLVYTEAGPIRGFPRGLDVFAVLSSERAYEILEEEGDTEYQNFLEQFTKLKREFSFLNLNDWAQNLYWNWLYSLLPLLDEKGQGYPVFMQNRAWTEKELFTALGSWTELRHDTILYAKQSYTIKATAMPIERLSKGYVEPNPHIYARLAALSFMMRDGLSKRGLLSDEYALKLKYLEDVLISLKVISEKELETEPLTEEELKLIFNFGEILEELLSFEKAIEQEVDESVEVVADVHTDVNSLKVLEEGVGRVFEIYVIVEIEGATFVSLGGIFSYYEFKHPMNDRLSDEKWQAMKKPNLPSWTQSFIPT
ncbi:MAG: DUF3160 domain-containing protein [Candidatus Methanofastidiosia archaeon]